MQDLQKNNVFTERGSFIVAGTVIKTTVMKS
jgi:hypothetical protein